jgi:hypothetical protein
MLLPRFTIRTLLVLLTVCAAVFVMVGTAYRGQSWAWGVTIGIFSLLVTAAVHAAWFSLVKLVSRLFTPPAEFLSVAAARELRDQGLQSAATDEHRATVPPSVL